jgi:stage II sporulation protein D
MIRRPAVAHRSRLRSRGCRLMMLLAAALAILPSCQTTPTAGPGAPRTPAEATHRSQPPVPPPATAAIRAEPDVRVRVVTAAPAVTLAARSPLVIGPLTAGLAQPRPFDPPVTIARRDHRFVITDRHGQALGWGVPALRIESHSGDGQLISVDGTDYPGAIAIHPNAGSPALRLDAVNHVPIEQYLPGVIERELFPRWHPEAFVAQAIAARSYAIAQQSVNTDRHFDLESTTASQVYGGAASNPKAIDAVHRTRGQVLTYSGRVVPGFYSSCAGGVGQSAVAAFPDVRLDVNIAPLMGRNHGWGRSSNNFTWGPFTRDTADLSRRIAAWGRANRDAVASLATLTHVEVAQRSPTGRPASFRLRDSRGQTFILAAEHFRFACNHQPGGGDGLASLPATAQLKSSNVDVDVRGGSVVFSNGRGFGHGVGMCQWSAQEMAQAGNTGHAIVTFFYPGAAVERVY